MKKIFIFVLAFFFIPCMAKVDPFTITFGTMKENYAGTLDIEKKTLKIPLYTRETGFQFGFAIDPNDYFQQYALQTVYYLPKKPTKLTGDLTGKDSNNFKAGLKTSVQYFSGYMVYPISFDKGDPVGNYKVEIYIDYVLVKTINFTVYKPKK